MPSVRCGMALLLVPVAILCAAAKPAAKKKAPTASVAKELIQMERDWSQAGISRDAATMGRIIADDWISVDFQGKSVTKQQALAELKSSPTAPQGIELGEMKVRVLGTTAIVTGQDSTRKYAWMDVFMKRDGHWQAVASQSTKVEK